MTAPRSGVCTPWADASDLCAPCIGTGATIPTADQFQAASDVLFELSGRQFPGACDITVRPCARPSPEASGGWWPGREWDSRLYGGNGSFEGGNLNSNWLWGWCDCNREERTGGYSTPSIALGASPINSIAQVKIDGVVIPSAEYVVHDYSLLIKRPAADGSRVAWPCCQRMELPDTEKDTFSITFNYGKAAPAMGTRAAAELACQLAVACGPNPGDCRLPERVTQVQRQGVTMLVLDPMQFLDQGKTGLYTVDLFLSTYNPKKLRRRAGVMTPDRAPAMHRQTWP